MVMISSMIEAHSIFEVMMIENQSVLEEKKGNTLIDNQSVWEVTLKILHVP